MAAAIDGGDHLPADDGIGDLPGEVQQAIGAAGAALEALEFIDLPAALEAEPPEQCKGGFFGEDGNIEDTGTQDHIVGEVGFIHRDQNSLGIGGDLHGGIDDAAVILFALPRGEDEQTVAVFEHGFILQQRCIDGCALRQGGGDKILFHAVTLLFLLLSFGGNPR